MIETLAHVPRGLILLTGATGSGKTTTLAGIINHINENYARHIVTVEDPIEIMHKDKRSVINQREIGQDTASFGQALRRALRQDPDVILIGEMRDEETVRTAISAAETGHLVLSTLHTIDVMESIYRILDFFPPALERQARSMLAGALKGIVSQRLVQSKDGRSRVPAVEVLVGTSRIADCIARPEETEKIHDALAEGGYYGMQTFDQSLLQLVVDDVVSVEEAMFHATSKQNFALLLEASSVSIDKDMRRRASGSMTSIQDDIEYDERRHQVQPTAAPFAQPAASPGQAPGILAMPPGAPGVMPGMAPGAGQMPGGQVPAASWAPPASQSQGPAQQQWIDPATGAVFQPGQSAMPQLGAQPMVDQYGNPQQQGGRGAA